jgi:hypothetical protein
MDPTEEPPKDAHVESPEASPPADDGNEKDDSNRKKAIARKRTKTGCLSTYTGDRIHRGPTRAPSFHDLSTLAEMPRLVVCQVVPMNLSRLLFLYFCSAIRFLTYLPTSIPAISFKPVGASSNFIIW